MTEPQGPPGQPDEAELRRQLEQEMARIRVEDVIVQTAVTLVNLAGDRLGLTGSAERLDVGQAKLAIEGARALAPLLPAEAQGPVRDALSQIQIAFARAAGGEQAAAGGEAAGGEGSGAASSGAPAPPPPGGGKPSPEESAAEAERAKARAKIWTPPGA